MVSTRRQSHLPPREVILFPSCPFSPLYLFFLILLILLLLLLFLFFLFLFSPRRCGLTSSRRHLHPIFPSPSRASRAYTRAEPGTRVISEYYILRRLRVGGSLAGSEARIDDNDNRERTVISPWQDRAPSSFILSLDLAPDFRRAMYPPRRPQFRSYLRPREGGRVRQRRPDPSTRYRD